MKTKINPMIFYLRHSDLCVSLDGGGLSLAEGLEVSHVVIHVLYGEGEDLNSHSTHVGGRDLPDQACELVPVLVDLLHGEGAQDGPQVALQGLQDCRLDLVLLLAEELLGGRVEQLGIFHYFDLKIFTLNNNQQRAFCLTWATPVTVRGTPWAVSTFSQIGLSVITSRDNLQILRQCSHCIVREERS